MYCTNCGMRFDGGEKFCTNCGARLEPADPPVTAGSDDEGRYSNRDIDGNASPGSEYPAQAGGYPPGYRTANPQKPKKKAKPPKAKKIYKKTSGGARELSISSREVNSPKVNISVSATFPLVYVT